MPVSSDSNSNTERKVEGTPRSLPPTVGTEPEGAMTTMTEDLTPSPGGLTPSPEGLTPSPGGLTPSPGGLTPSSTYTRTIPDSGQAAAGLPTERMEGASSWPPATRSASEPGRAGGDGRAEAGPRSQETMSFITGSLGEPFSAIIPSMRPTDVVIRISPATGDPTEVRLDQRFDEFGFMIDKDTNPDRRPVPFVEDASHRHQWSAYLELAQHQQLAERTCINMCWKCSRAFSLVKPADETDQLPVRSEKLGEMVTQGVPHSLRPRMWMRLSGAWRKKKQSAVSYHAISAELGAQDEQSNTYFRQIEEDLPRTMSSNACFWQPSSPGVGRLRRVLRALARRYPDTGYCQGTGVVVACLLLFLEEEDAFWMMCALVEDLLPDSYYSSTLTGIQVDQRVLRQLLVSCVPSVDRLLQDHDVELSLITVQWFTTLFAGVLDIRVLLRLWDLLFYSGSHVLFHFALGLLKLKEDEVKKLDNSAQFFSTLPTLAADITDANDLIKHACRMSGSLTRAVVSMERHKYMTYLIASQRVVLNPEDRDSLPPQKRSQQSQRSRKGRAKDNREEEEEGRGWNRRHTDSLVWDLGEAIMLLTGHCRPPSALTAARTTVQADCSVESHIWDMDNFVKQYCSRHCHRHQLRYHHNEAVSETVDEEATSFCKNDSISQEERFVQEGKPQEPNSPRPISSNLAEMRYEAISDLVKCRLSPALQAVFAHGLKKSKLIRGDRHPWLFIEEAAQGATEEKETETCCRQELCRTYRLDEDDCKIPTPEELLQLAVRAISTSEDLCHAHMDLKFHSLLCCGLNEQVLHLWLECLCCNTKVVTKWYQPWALLRTPAWVHLKCQLRLLSSNVFQLCSSRGQEAGHGRRTDLASQGTLSPHQLFSWDL